MKIFVDENIPFMTVQELLGLGHDVMDIRGTEHEGITDKELWKIVQKEKRLLISTDKGFVQNRYEKHHGILIIRLKQPNRLKIHQEGNERDKSVQRRGMGAHDCCHAGYVSSHVET